MSRFWRFACNYKLKSVVNGVCHTQWRDHMERSKEIMAARDIKRTLDRLACQILEQITDHGSIALVGIQRRGADLAYRLCDLLSAHARTGIPCGELDINLYRDDWTSSTATPNINATRIDFSVEDKTIILIDDVLFTGRTIRCALEAILDFGRPRAVKLLVLVDRGYRELPIQADFVGKAVATERCQQVNVFLWERDGRDQVVLG
jgi:pyrimidine operon attenuation protein/uracil phosphoribosyltransferase